MTKLLIGDCHETLKSLEDQSINTVITSPPYFGLRDYGTAEWVGGDPNCDHIDRSKQGGGVDSKKQRTSVGTQNLQYQKVCSKCGSVRKDKQLGMEDTPEEFVDNLVAVFREIKRVLRDDGTVWLNLGDSYAMSSMRGVKPKNLIGIPWRVAFALQQDGWYLRQDIIWHKPNPMPESVKDRCTKAHEYIFLLSKSPKYYFDNEAIKEEAKFPDGPNTPSSIKAVEGVYSANLQKIGANNKRNKRSVWTVTTKPYKEAHFATFPMDLIEPCVLAGCPEKICVDCGMPYKRIMQQPKPLEVKRGRRAGTDDRLIGGVLDKYKRENPPIDLGLQKQCDCKTNETKVGTVLDPFGGSGTTAQAAHKHGRDCVLCELNADYVPLIEKRLNVGDIFMELEVVNYAKKTHSEA